MCLVLQELVQFIAVRHTESADVELWLAVHYVFLFLNFKIDSFLRLCTWRVGRLRELLKSLVMMYVSSEQSDKSASAALCTLADSSIAFPGGNTRQKYAT